MLARHYATSTTTFLVELRKNRLTTVCNVPLLAHKRGFFQSYFFNIYTLSGIFIINFGRCNTIS
nr:hypothetical protein [Polaribacter batillariae]